MFGKIKKFTLSLSVVVLFALYALQRQSQPSEGASEIASYVKPVPTVVTEVETDAPPVIEPPTETAVPAFVEKTRTVSAPKIETPTPSSFSKNKPEEKSANPTKTPVPKPSRTPTEVVEPTSTPEGQYRDGNYTGVQADAHWGIVQVVAVIENGELVDVQFAEFPNHRSRSKTINNRAMPLLIQEAIDSQQAEVDIVSGATDTSEAFIQSLSFALGKAAS